MTTQGKAAKVDLATILQRHTDNLPELLANSWKQRALFAIARCRTPEMGGHIDKCSHQACGKLHISYNSCRNRHCPKCQGHKQEQWVEAREQELLNTTYFHVVFTLPACLNECALRYPKQVYNALYKAAWSTLKDFGINPKFLGAQTGMIAVMHTWGQNLSLHPHLHCIVPAGGVTKQGKWKASKNKGQFLFPVKTMSKVYRARYLSALRKEVTIPKEVSKKMFAKNWVVYCKRPFFGPKQVVEYLGRYTHKIAISNHRIKNIRNGKVYFTAKDYRHGGKKALLALKEEEFIRRFSLHILPRGYTRIRHFGILSSTSKKKCKTLVDGQIGALILHKTEEKVSLHRVCPTCKVGKLQTLITFDKRGPPLLWLEKLQICMTN